MKTCRVMRIPESHMNYAILKNFNDHMQVTISYMDFKQVLRNNRGQIDILDIFNCCFPSKYRFERRHYMTEKRFVEQNLENHLNKVYDTKKGKVVFDSEVVELLNELNDENKQLKSRIKELRNDLIDHSALINMLEDVKQLSIEEIIWNAMDYHTQTEFDDDFADYRENAKKRWI